MTSFKFINKHQLTDAMATVCADLVKSAIEDGASEEKIDNLTKATSRLFAILLCEAFGEVEEDGNNAE